MVMSDPLVDILGSLTDLLNGSQKANFCWFDELIIPASESPRMSQLSVVEAGVKLLWVL